MEENSTALILFLHGNKNVLINENAKTRPQHISILSRTTSMKIMKTPLILFKMRAQTAQH